MARWLTLMITLAVWVMMMAWVYVEHRAPATAMDADSDRLALEALFDERSTEREVWRIYFDPRQMRVPRSKPYGPEDGEESVRQAAMAEAQWAGAREGEVRIGTREVKLAIRGFTRAEVTSHMKLEWPEGFGEVPLQFSGSLTEEGSMRFSRERGLEEVKARARMFAALELRAEGHREGDELKLTLAFHSGPGKRLMEQEMAVSMKGACAPTFGLSPFFFNPNVNVGSRWTIATLNLAPQDRGRMSTMTVRVTDRKTVQYMGLPTPVFEATARGENTRSTGYYSPDGQVLIQHVQFANLRLTMIREELRLTQP